MTKSELMDKIKNASDDLEIYFRCEGCEGKIKAPLITSFDIESKVTRKRGYEEIISKIILS